MPITENDIVYVNLPNNILYESIETSLKMTDHIIDRQNLHKRDNLERFINILMGEVSEQMVIYWLQTNQKFAQSAVDKGSKAPDAGHDILIKKTDGAYIKASVKSSLSVLKFPREILSTFTLATTASEVREVNIQAYFWLSINDKPRVNVPSLRQSALIAWAGKKDLDSEFEPYKGEKRSAPKTKLQDFRPMTELLVYLI